MKLYFSKSSQKKRIAIYLSKFKEQNMNSKRKFNHKSKPSMIFEINFENRFEEKSKQNHN